MWDLNDFPAPEERGCISCLVNTLVGGVTLAIVGAVFYFLFTIEIKGVDLIYWVMGSVAVLFSLYLIGGLILDD
jgi:hypothetical protein